jgi:hypothetical protein
LLGIVSYKPVYLKWNIYWKLDVFFGLEVRTNGKLRLLLTDEEKCEELVI